MLILNPLERPPCPKCHTSMMLARISPDGPGFENRSYECRPLKTCARDAAEVMTSLARNSAPGARLRVTAEGGTAQGTNPKRGTDRVGDENQNRERP
jgi:hypothetical protein